MRRCERCNVSVSGSHEKCPLCQGSLRGEPTPDVFPVLDSVYRRHGMLFKTLLFLSITVSITAVAFNLKFPNTGWWSLLVVAAAGCIWLWLFTVLRRRSNILNDLTNQALLLGVLSLLWDWLTGWHGWSIDYVIPLTFVCTMITVSIVAQVMRLPAESYLVYLFLLISFGIIPAVFIAANWSHTDIPSYICVTISLISLAALLIYERRAMHAELKRRLHL
ncbi:MAG: DUF6320 domain-containing protein [Oscillospiraceae bacterium]